MVRHPAALEPFASLTSNASNGTWVESLAYEESERDDLYSRMGKNSFMDEWSAKLDNARCKAIVQ